MELTRFRGHLNVRYGGVHETGSTPVAFGGLALKATVYIYASADPPPLDASVESDRVIDEFRTAVGDALGMNESCTVRSSRLVSGSTGSSCFAMAVLEQLEEHMSWVILTARDGFFVKGRITCEEKDLEIHQMVQESIIALINEIHPEAGITAVDLAEAGQDSADDAVDRLLEEFRGWYLNMADAGNMPRAFTGIKADGRQFVVALEGLGLDRVQYLQFLVWFCMRESIESYVCARPVQALDESDPENPRLQLELELCGSSASKDAVLTVTADRLESGAIRYGKPVRHSPYDGPFAGLQRQAPELAPNQGQVFDELWQGLRKKAFWPGEK